MGARRLIVLGVAVLVACSGSKTAAPTTTTTSRASSNAPTTAPATAHFTADAGPPGTTAPRADVEKKSSDVGGTWIGTWASDGSENTDAMRVSVVIDSIFHVSGSVEIDGPILGPQTTFPSLSIDLALDTFPKFGELVFSDDHGNSLHITDLANHTGRFEMTGLTGHPEVASVSVTVSRTEDAAHPAPGQLDGTYTITFTTGSTSTGKIHLDHS